MVLAYAGLSLTLLRGASPNDTPNAWLYVPLVVMLGSNIALLVSSAFTVAFPTLRSKQVSAKLAKACGLMLLLFFAAVLALFLVGAASAFLFEVDGPPYT